MTRSDLNREISDLEFLTDISFDSDILLSDIERTYDGLVLSSKGNPFKNHSLFLEEYELWQEISVISLTDKILLGEVESDNPDIQFDAVVGKIEYIESQDYYKDCKKVSSTKGYTIAIVKDSTNIEDEECLDILRWVESEIIKAELICDKVLDLIDFYNKEGVDS